MAKAKTAAAGTIQNVRLADALGERYLAYALSTIVSRSLPDVRDGLKPVHRRLLFAMRELKLDPKSGFKKCARVVGDVMGKYHPHGDVAIYDSLVRMSQEFAQRYPLVDGQGNFGNIDGDNAAAMRYTEARLTPVALALLDGLDDDAVDFRDTYDGEEREPVVLPAAFPNLLANGATGIAVGMATNIPPHNAHELCTALIHLIENRPKTKNINESQVTFKKLVEMIPGPDFPTGGIIVEPAAAVIEAYRTGRGGFRLRARWHQETLGRGQYRIVVTEIPYQVQKSRLIEKTAALLVARKLPLLADIHDESSEDLRLVLEPRNRTVEPEVLMEQMFRQTDLEVRIGLNMNALDAHNTPRVMDLRRVLTAFLEHRYRVLERRSRHRLAKIERRLEILDGMLISYVNLDRIIPLIRREDEPKPKLMKAFKLTDVQAEAILNMRLRQLRRLEEVSIKKEHKGLSTERTALNRLLKDKRRKWQAVAGEIAEIKQRFGPQTALGRRRTEIGKPPSAVVVPLEARIEREPVTVVCSDKGWIRAVKGHLTDGDGLKYKEGDRGRFALLAQTTDRLIVFATNGRAYTVGCDTLPAGRGHGEPLRLMIDLPDGHDVLNMRIHDAGGRLVVASASGRGFVVAERDIIAQTRNGKQVLNLAVDEEAAACVPVIKGADSLALLGDNRRLLIIKLKELPLMARGRGVILQRYREGGLADLKTFKRAQGLAWRSGRGERTETDLEFWTGKRGQAGHVVPKGFPRANRFG